jgi:GAF domain-containing protein
VSEDRLRAAVASGVLGSEERFRALLQSVVDVARAIFGAKAASVFLLDEEADELVFEAVAGQGEGELVGMRFPSSTGIAGWVLVTGQPLVVDDVRADQRFSQQAAQATGYVPTTIMAVPLLQEEGAVGVLEVLDPPGERRFGLADMELLTLFAGQAAIALDLLRRARQAQSLIEGGGGTDALVARVAAALDARDDDAGRRLLAALEDVLRQQ